MLTNHSKTGSLSSNLTFFLKNYMATVCEASLSKVKVPVLYVLVHPGRAIHQFKDLMGLKLASNEISIHMRKMGGKRSHITNYGPLQWETSLRN